MEISEKQFEKIKNLMLIERKPAKISNQQFLNALLYIVENGYKWRSLPEKFGKWIYMNFNRWWKNETIQRIFEELQRQKIIDVQSKSLCLDKHYRQGSSKCFWSQEVKQRAKSHQKLEI